MDLRRIVSERVLVLDGAMGTQVQALGLSDSDFGGPEFRMLTDILTWSRPEAICEIHKSYLDAGADAIETNTFGSSPLRLAEFDFSRLDISSFPTSNGDPRTMSIDDIALTLNRNAARLAREACRDTRREAYVFGSIGPSNWVLSSTAADLKLASFDQIVQNYEIQARGLLEGEVDALLFETQQDILETRAAVIGARHAMKTTKRPVPVITQVTVDPFCRMQLFNTDILAALTIMEAIGVDAFGINCSIGPDLMAKTVERMARLSNIPISVVPNAGLPESENGRTVFRFAPERMASILGAYVREHGVNIVGGCCGTTPSHIAAIAEAVRGVPPTPRPAPPMVYVSGPQEAVPLDSSESLIRIGERLNARGSKKVREAVEGGAGIDHDTLEEVVHEQVHELGLNLIDVCMDSNVVDTAHALREVVHRQTRDFPGAMSIDSFAVDALVEAIRAYPGRAIINSISMEPFEPGMTKADAVLKATCEHGPVYIGLATGPDGPASTAPAKAALGRQLMEKAAEYNVGPERLFIDMNVFPIGSESSPDMNFAVESLNAIPLIKALHPALKTVCGVGNLTNGLASKPYMRTVLTSVWLDEARKRGLDAAILNPNHYVIASDLDQDDYQLAQKIIFDHDMEAFALLEEVAIRKKGRATEHRTSYADLPPADAVCEKIKDGFKHHTHGSLEMNGRLYRYSDSIVLEAAEVIRHMDPLEFINAYLMKAMNALGDGFAQGDVSLPHLLKSADLMKHVMGFLEALMRDASGADPQTGIEYKGTVVIGTVYQDVHSIGKDLAKTLLENYGYRVIDLGVMTPLQRFLDAAVEYNADAIGMSALLVQTSNHMIAVAKMAAEQHLDHIPLLIGGAPVNERHASWVALAGNDDASNMRGDVFYCATAMDGVTVMNALRNPTERPTLITNNRDKLIRARERALKKAGEMDALLKSLPRRSVPFDNYTPIKPDYFAYQAVSIGLKEFREYLDQRTLIALNWKFGGSLSRERQGETIEKLDHLFEHWIEHAAHNQWVRPAGVMGLFPCQSLGDEVILYDPHDLTRELYRFTFDVVVGAGRKDLISAAQYFRSRDSGLMDVIGLQLTTSGPQVDTYINRFREEGDSESCLYLQGLSDRVAEDMADLLHGMLRQRIGVEEDRGVRWSPGYPAVTRTEYNEAIHALLHAGDLLGVTVTSAGEFSPTGTTAAFVCFHPDARYT